MNIFPLFNFFGGRATTFAIFFAGAGTWLALHGHLDATYVALITAIQGLVFAHSWKEDIMEWKNGQAAKSNKDNTNASQSN